MSANLISLASKYLEPDILSKIASAIGEGKNVTGAASGAAIPALLSGLADLASSKDGVRRLERAMGEQGTHTLDVFGTSIGGSGRKISSAMASASSAGCLAAANFRNWRAPLQGLRG